MAQQPTPCLLGLPPEVRCRIYDFYFTDLVEAHETDPDHCKVPTERPNNDFTGYTSLVLNCKLINQEAVPIFKKAFVPRVKLHFETIMDLFNFCKRIRGRGFATSAMKFSFHGLSFRAADEDGSRDKDIWEHLSCFCPDGVHCTVVMLSQWGLNDLSDRAFCEKCSLEARLRHEAPPTTRQLISPYGDPFTIVEEAYPGSTKMEEVTGRFGSLDWKQTMLQEAWMMGVSPQEAEEILMPSFSACSRKEE